MRFSILTLFPEMFSGPLDHSIVQRARQAGVVSTQLVQLRDFAHGRQRQVDDAPYGGGPGMVLQPQVVERALDQVVSEGGPALVVYLSPQGERFTQETARELAQRSHVALICGHYEGLDERLVAARVDRELSVGDFVLTGGELAAMLVVDAVTRLLPGALGDAESALADSFSGGLLDHPHYTRPPLWQGREAPPVLRSGNHGAVAAWRRRQALLRTIVRRPDLLAGADLTRAERRVVEALLQGLAGDLDDPRGAGGGGA